MKIAIMGIRGIPANYGGFETFAEEIAPRLVERGHEVTVYGRSNNIKYIDEFYKGVRIVILPTISHKYFDTVAHSFLTTLHGLFNKYDVILFCNSANSVYTFLPRVMGTKVVINVDGLEWKRAKWNVFGKNFYKISEFLSTILPNAVVTDSKEIQYYYEKKFKKKSTFIPYGAPTQKAQTKESLEQFDLEPQSYLLYVSRFEPENNTHLVLKAFEQVKTDKKLVMIGGAPYSASYIKNLKSTTDPRIVFTGFVYGTAYKELQSNSYFYIQATQAGGTQPALLDGMGHGNCILANDVPQHREVLSDAGIYFTKNNKDDLSAKMKWLCDHPEIVEKYKKISIKRVREKYSWNKVTQDYENLFFKLLRSNNSH